MISRKKSILLGLTSATLLAIAGCSSGPSAKTELSPAPILNGDWKGDLTIPQEFSSNRGMSDTTCDAASGRSSNLLLSVHSSGKTVNVTGSLQCSLRGKKVYTHQLSAASFELKGEDLILNGKTAGRATTVYFSANLPEGKLTVVKFPTWEKIYFESSSPAADKVTLSGVFADRKTFAEDEAPSTTRNPASD